MKKDVDWSNFRFILFLRLSPDDDVNDFDRNDETGLFVGRIVTFWRHIDTLQEDELVTSLNDVLLWRFCDSYLKTLVAFCGPHSDAKASHRLVARRWTIDVV